VQGSRGSNRQVFFNINCTSSYLLVLDSVLRLSRIYTKIYTRTGTVDARVSYRLLMSKDEIKVIHIGPSFFT
jgi:hypothetical protein